MKVLLDEMYNSVIARQLRDRGRDAEAVTEHPELRARSDRDLFALAQSEQRAVVTENIDDFSAIANDHDQRGQAHFGLVLVSPGRYPRSSPGTSGRMVSALDRLLSKHPGDTPTSLRHWL